MDIDVLTMSLRIDFKGKDLRMRRKLSFARVISLVKRLYASFVLKNNIRRIEGWGPADLLKRVLIKNPQLRTELSKEERHAIKKYWGRFGYPPPPLSFYSLAKGIWGDADPRMICDSYWFNLILPKINGYLESAILEDKGIYGFLFKDIKRPREIVRNIRGIFYDEENQMISQDMANALVREAGTRFLYKPLFNTEQGQGIVLVDSSSPEMRTIICEHHDYVIQELVQQHPSLAAFNESSLNCIRVTTCIINGEFSVLSLCLKVGCPGSWVDNFGAGGYFVGLKLDGGCREYALAKDGTLLFERRDSIRFDSLSVPNIDKVLLMAERIQKMMPYVPFIGIDVAIDTKGEPVLIELNCVDPGIMVEQLVAGPIFGKRSDEILAYTRTHRPPVYNKAHFRYDCYIPPRVFERVIGCSRRDAVVGQIVK